MNGVNARQQALLRGMEAAQPHSRDRLGTENCGRDGRCSTLDYAMAVLGDRRTIEASEGSFNELLEINNIAHRQICTPSDLLQTTHTMLIAFAADDGRALAVHRQGGRTLVYDGVQGRREPLSADLALKPYAFELYAALPQPLRSLSSLLGFAFSSAISPLLTVLFSALVVALFNLTLPLLTAYLVGTLLPQSDLRLIVETSLLVLLVALCSVLAQGFSSLASLRTQALLNLRLEAALWNHLLRLPFDVVQRLGAADLVARMGSISQMRQLLSGGLLSTALALLFSLSNLGLMVVIQRQLALVAVLFNLVSSAVLVLLVLQASKLEQPLHESQARVGNLGLQAVLGMAPIRVSGSEPFVFEQWIGAVVRLGGLLRRSEARNHSLAIAARLLTPLGQVVLFIALLALINQPGTQTVSSANQLVATVVAFQAAYLAFSSQLSALATQAASAASQLVVLWQRARVVMLASPEDGQSGTATRLHTLEGRLELQSLQVRYADAPAPLLHNVNLSIANGSYTAITGPSGCGKSTLLRCLLRLLEPEAGVISIDGIDLRELAVRPYRRQLGVVLQNAPLPTGSIANVVRAGRACSREAVWDALERAAVADDVARMPMKLETIISEGAMGISGGQRQRLSLARALLGQPRVLLLDEATSALDAPTQAAISRTLDALKITRIAIAHRLSTIESADQIAVIHGGTIDELGSYSELRRNPGSYLNRR